MANQKHIEILRQGEEIWNRWRQDNPGVIPDLSGESLKDIELSRMDLRNVDFSNTIIEKVNFFKTDVSKANFSEAELFNVIFHGASLLGTNFTKAELTGVEFNQAKLFHADFRGASLGIVDFNGARLLDIKYDNSMLCRCVCAQGCLGSQRFSRHIMDLDYIDEVKRRQPGIYRFWKWTSDCGRSWGRWSLWSICLAFLFGTLFVPSICWEQLPQWTRVVLPHLNYNVPDMNVSLFTPYYFSIVTFTTLGFGDITPLNLAGQIWLTLEVVLGYIMLGGLISLFATKMVRQSG